MPFASEPIAGLLDRVRERIRLKHYSIRTEQAYCLLYTSRCV